MVKSLQNLRTTITLALCFLFVNGLKTFAQETSAKSTYNWFDKKVGIETLPISNGKLHLNSDKTIDNKHRYYASDKPIQGRLSYDSQEYFDVNLKYDIFKDEIILTSVGMWKLTEVNLTKEKVQYFKLNGKKFINLDIYNQLPENFRSGYYEENVISKNFTFYIKHYKIKKEIIKDQSLYIDYNNENEFVLFIEGKYNNINNKRQLLKFFPNYKNQINNYYLINSNLKRENLVQFMENLLNYIKSISIQ